MKPAVLLAALAAAWLLSLAAAVYLSSAVEDALHPLTDDMEMETE